MCVSKRTLHICASRPVLSCGLTCCSSRHPLHNRCAFDKNYFLLSRAIFSRCNNLSSIIRQNSKAGLFAPKTRTRASHVFRKIFPTMTNNNYSPRVICTSTAFASSLSRPGKLPALFFFFLLCAVSYLSGLYGIDNDR